MVGLATLLTFLLARRVGPGRGFLALGSAVFVALFPQDVFYVISNDVPAVWLFPLALLLLWRARDRDASDGVRLLAGLCVAAAFLVKPVNIALVVAAVVLLLPPFVRGLRQHENGTWRRALVPALAAAVPVVAWLGYKVAATGVLTGLAERNALTGATPRTFGEMLQHPLFTPAGAWTFVSELTVRFFNGELYWHGVPMHSRAVGLAFGANAVWFVGTSARASLRRVPDAIPGAFAAAVWASGLAGVLVLVWMSISIHFGRNFYPSEDFPYFVSGRLLCGMVAPLAILWVDGLERVTRRFGRHAPWLALAAFALLLVAIETRELAIVAANPHDFWH